MTRIVRMLDGKTALITGGTQGIGLATACAFAAEGASVAITGRREDASEALSKIKECAAPGSRIEYFRADASDFELAHEVADRVVGTFGHLDILVCNAGMTSDALLMRMSEEQWDKVISADLKSTFNYVHAVSPIMARQRGGSVICISSVVGEDGNPGQCNYAAAKAGVIALVKSVAKELGGRGVRANCIAPGMIDTAMTAGMPDSWKETWTSRIALKRAGRPEEVAGVALFLASDLSSYVSGQVLNCCGGLS